MNYKEYRTKHIFSKVDNVITFLDIDNIFSMIRTIVVNQAYPSKIADVVIVNPITSGGTTTIEGSKNEIDIIYKELSEYLLAKNNTKAKTEKILNQLKPKQPANINE